MPALLAEVERLRSELLAEEGRLLDARRFVNPRAKKELDHAARRLRMLADGLDGTEAEAVSTPLVRYRDAVVDALMAAGVGVRDNVADENGPIIEIELDPVSAVRQPVMDWTPTTGWRVAVTCRGKIRPATVRYLASGPVPLPDDVAADVARWLANPAALTDVRPIYDTVPHLIERALAEAAGAPR